jgi:hypothetical protein
MAASAMRALARSRGIGLIDECQHSFLSSGGNVLIHKDA